MRIERMHQRMAFRVVTAGFAAVLLVAVFFTGGQALIRSLFFPLPTGGRPAMDVLDAILPREDELRDEWRMAVDNLGDSPEMDERVKKILRFDAAVSRSYRTQVSRVSVYAAYWQPGKIAPREVACHTPDVCWESAGWLCTDATTQDIVVRNDLAKLPTKVRRFSRDGAVENVVFWHVSGREIVSYSDYGLPPVGAFFGDFLDNLLRQPKEQMFIRISSSLAPEEMLAKPPARAVLERMHTYLKSSASSLPLAAQGRSGPTRQKND